MCKPSTAVGVGLVLPPRIDSQVAETLLSSRVLRHGATSKPALSVTEGCPKDLEKYVRALAPEGISRERYIQTFLGSPLEDRDSTGAGWEPGRTTRAAFSCVTANVSVEEARQVLHRPEARFSIHYPLSTAR